MSKTASENRYGFSKLCQILCSYEFQRIIAEDSSDIQSIVIHSGGVNTAIWIWMPENRFTHWFRSSLLMTPAQAANVGMVAGLRTTLEESCCTWLRLRTNSKAAALSTTM